MIANRVSDVSYVHVTFKVPPPEKKQKKETLLSAELGKYLDKKIRVKFQGGREGIVQKVHVTLKSIS